MAETPKHTEDADPMYLYGTKEEVASRLEGGLGPTESSFTQIKPTTAPGGRAAKQTGETRSNRAVVKHRG